MNPSFQYDPEFHKIRDVPVTAYLRREIKLPKTTELVTYYSEIGETWAVALREGDSCRGYSMVDIGLLGNGLGEGPWCSHPNAQRIVEAMKRLIPAAEEKQRRKLELSRSLKDWQERQDKREESRQAIGRSVGRRHGELAREKWLRGSDLVRTAPKLA